MSPVFLRDATDRFDRYPSKPAEKQEPVIPGGIPRAFSFPWFSGAGHSPRDLMFLSLTLSIKVKKRHPKTQSAQSQPAMLRGLNLLLVLQRVQC